MKEVIQLLLKEIADECPHRFPLRGHCRRSQLRLGLTLENRFLDPHRDRANQPRSNIRGIVALLIEISQHLDNRLTKSSQMGPPLCSMLTIHE